jgi:NTE family protein
MAIVATNFKTGEPEIITDGDLSLAIRASISIPLFFQPVKREKELLVDGGMTIPVPIKPLRKMGADIVIAVNLYNYPR